MLVQSLANNRDSGLKFKTGSTSCWVWVFYLNDFTFWSWSVFLCKMEATLTFLSCEDSVKSFTESDKLMLGRNGNVWPTYVTKMSINSACYFREGTGPRPEERARVLWVKERGRARFLSIPNCRSLRKAHVPGATSMSSTELKLSTHCKMRRETNPRRVDEG